MHVLFDESNSLSENDVQDEDFELGLTKKDCLSNHEQGKNCLLYTSPSPRD